MAEVVSLMDIDNDDSQQKENHSQKLNKGKNVVTATDTKATPWVEKYRPQSLADVAAHRDIVDTTF
ncbi:putative replication factor C / DNA polymerase III gamma-tau subunit [Corchorus olitorius]|uniref:Replication factor C / DNA polymerase III gamma-tau subunit n=1 Tax=Corchorus olitorius TaxID=93759 RepID=A0A1R3FXT8_9ROSI|nr:putative replication factor C / DNA polymerase III gamma-tau subunit [Corchorus olitorius]